MMDRLTEEGRDLGIPHERGSWRFDTEMGWHAIWVKRMGTLWNYGRRSWEREGVQEMEEERERVWRQE